jgi:hypothetical protein
MANLKMQYESIFENIMRKRATICQARRYDMDCFTESGEIAY